MQEKARAEVIGVLGNEPVIPTSDQLKVNYLPFTFDSSLIYIRF